MKNAKAKKSPQLKRRAIALAVAYAFATNQVWANGSGATVVSGTAAITTVGNTMTVANSPGAIINWHDFSIGVGETTIFSQVNAASTVLNRVTGGDISQILGTLKSNGQVYLINPSGIVFGANSVVNVAGLVASTLNISNADFSAGKLKFNADTANSGSVINNGTITTPTGGFVYLLAPKVENNGIITTPSGEAILAAGNSVEIVDSVNPSQRVLVSAQSQDVNLSNLMTQSNGNIFSVLNTKTISANTVQQDATGRIFFKSAGTIQTTSTSVVEAHGDTQNNGGTITGFADVAGVYAGKFDATGKNGGFVETSGHYLDVTGIDLHANALTADGNAGSWLLDPYNIEIVLTGGANSTSLVGNITPTGSPSKVLASDIETALNGGTNVTINTTVATNAQGSGPGSEDGTITLSASIFKTAGSNTSLSFVADKDIILGGYIISSSGSTTGKLNLLLSADADGNASGAISLTNTQILTNGGNITLAGGSTTGNGYAIGTSGSIQDGVSLNNSQLDSGGGNITIRGQGASDTTNSGFVMDHSTLTSGGGAIVIAGAGGDSGGNDIAVTNASFINAGAGNVTLNANTNIGGYGLLVNDGSGIQGNNLTMNMSGRNINLVGGSATNTSATVEFTGNTNIINAGNINLAGGSGDTSNASLDTQGTMTITNAAGNINLQGGAGANSIAEIQGAQGVSITNGGDISVIGGNGNGAFAEIRASTQPNSGGNAANMIINTGGNVTIEGASSTGSGSYAEIFADNNLALTFTQLGKELLIEAGATGTGNYAALDSGVGTSALVGALTVKGDSDSNNPFISMHGGSGVNGISAVLAGRGAVNIRATSIDMTDSTQSGAATLIGSFNAQGGATYGVVNIDLYDGESAGELSMDGTSLGVAGIGNIFGNADIHINAGTVVLSGANASIGASGLLGNASSEAPANNAHVSIVATEGGVSIADGFVGSQYGSADIAITGTNTLNDSANYDGVNLNNADIYNATGGAITITGTGSNFGGRGITMSGGSVMSSDNSGSGNITLTGTGNGSGNTDGIFMNGGASVIANTAGNVVLNGTGSANGFSAAGISIADAPTQIFSTSGNITLNGTGLGSAGNSGGIVMFGAASPAITASNGNINLVGSSVVSNALLLPSANITALNGNVNLVATNHDLTINPSSNGDFSITAMGGRVNLSAPGGSITQASVASILSPILNASALTSIALPGSNNFSAGTFSAPTLTTLHTTTTGPLSFTFGQATTITSGTLTMPSSTDLSLNGLSDLTLDGISNGSQAGSISISAPTLTINNSTLSSTTGADINISSSNLSITSSSINTSGNVGVNAPTNLFTALAADAVTTKQIRQAYLSLNKTASINLSNNSSITGQNVFAAGGQVNVTDSFVSSNNITGVISQGEINVNAVASSSRIDAGAEVLLVAGKQININATGSTAASVNASLPSTIFLDFPLLTTGGYAVNGVNGAITSADGLSGFFANGLPAVLGDTMHVTYGATNISGIVSQIIKESSNLDSPFLPTDKDKNNKKSNDQKECS